MVDDSCCLLLLLGFIFLLMLFLLFSKIIFFLGEFLFLIRNFLDFLWELRCLGFVGVFCRVVVCWFKYKFFYWLCL